MRFERLAEAVALSLDDEAVVVCLLTGGLWFAADLMRALAARGLHPLFDALWLASYGDARAERRRGVGEGRTAAAGARARGADRG